MCVLIANLIEKEVGKKGFLKANLGQSHVM